MGPLTVDLKSTGSKDMFGAILFVLPILITALQELVMISEITKRQFHLILKIWDNNTAEYGGLLVNFGKNTMCSTL